MLYRLLYVIGQLALSQYFRSIHRRGAPPVERGPVVFVSNHFNGLLDALLVAGSLWRKCWFTAKSPLFLGWRGTVLSYLPAIPLYRPGEADTLNNLEVFRRTSELLGQGGAVVVFPYEFPAEFLPGERKLHKFKTGAARMALAAEEVAGGNLGVVVQPVGINYADFQAVGASVTLVFGEPVPVAKYLAWEDRREAVRACTAELDEQLHRLVVEIPRREHAALAESIAHLFASQANDDFALLSVIARQVRTLAPLDPDLAARFGTRIERYLALSEGLGLPPGSENLPLAHRWRIVLFAPLTLWGAVTHAPPAWCFARAARRLTEDPYFYGTLQFLLGLVGFPLWYLGLGLLTWWLLPSGAWAAGLVGLTIVAGVVVNKFGYRLNLLLTTLVPGRRARHLARLRELGAELRETLRGAVELDPNLRPPAAGPGAGAGAKDRAEVSE